MNIKEILQEQALITLEKLEVTGELEGGKNGPYNDNETPVRVSAHWIQLFEYQYKTGGDRRYYDAIKKLADYLVRQQCGNGAYICREKKGKDKINGTIGGAWIIEGLISAARILGDDAYYYAARKAFFSQNFDYKNGIWECVEVDGANVGVDMTYNHQLWLAAAGTVISRYKRDEEIDKRVLRFLDASKTLFKVHRSGLIYHFLYLQDSFMQNIRSYRRFLNEEICRRKERPSLQYKEEGYHFFCMYGFAIIHQYMPEHKFFDSKQFKMALKYASRKENALLLSENIPENDGTKLASSIISKCNIYGYSYNSPAFEIPFIYKEFNICLEQQFFESLIELQIKLTYNAETKMFDINTEDYVTLVARAYELTRIL